MALMPFIRGHPWIGPWWAERANGCLSFAGVVRSLVLELASARFEAMRRTSPEHAELICC